MDRRRFIQTSVALSGLAAVSPSCKAKKLPKGKILGASANIGHLLRDKKFDKPVSVVEKEVVIVGAGISGLSAAYHLQKAGISDFILLDLEEKPGGNSACGSNEVSAYPWGAHYVPIPNNTMKEYLAFLEEANVVTGYNAQGLPVYNELFLCFDPEERLYINGRWQEGLVPQFGIPEGEKRQIENFLSLMNDYRYKIGADGKEAFALPVDASSKDEVFTQLDGVTMKDWLIRQNFSSPHLHSFVNYCTRDDFGTPHDKVSAWAGIHYYACRKGKGANAAHHDVLTWPEGNGFLVEQLAKNISAQIQPACLATKVDVDDEKTTVVYFDVKANAVKVIEAKQCVMAVPHFVAARLLNDAGRAEKTRRHMHYVPWMVANLTVTKLEERSGAPISWDNVIFDSQSLGYVQATHQLLNRHQPKRNLTYYLPLTNGGVAEERKVAQSNTYAQWAETVYADLRRLHPNIEEATEELNVHLWGHAMAQPLPGLIHGGLRQELGTSLNGRLHFAHTDLAGVSLFEEGFYQGLNAADKIIQNRTA